MRLSLHPDGLAPRILNLGEWRGHLLHRLDRQLKLTGDRELGDLLEELQGYPAGEPAVGPGTPAEEVMVTLRLATERGELTFFSTVTTFGTALDITVSEISIEAFFPADTQTTEALSAAVAVG